MQVITYANTRKSIKTLMCHFNFTKRHLSIWKFSAKQKSLLKSSPPHYLELLSSRGLVLHPISTSNCCHTSIITNICNLSILFISSNFCLPSSFPLAPWAPKFLHSTRIYKALTYHVVSGLHPLMSFLPSVVSFNYGQSSYNYSFPPSPHHSHLEKFQSWLNPTVCSLCLC